MRPRTELALFSCLWLLGCQSNAPPRLDSFEIWTGPGNTDILTVRGRVLVWFGNPGDPGTVRVMPGPDGTLTLKLDARYVGRAYLRTSGRSDRCLYTIFTYTWRFPSREFQCYAVETDEKLVVDESIYTYWSDVARMQGNWKLTIQLREYDIASRTETHPVVIPHEFAVRFEE